MRKLSFSFPRFKISAAGAFLLMTLFSAALAETVLTLQYRDTLGILYGLENAGPVVFWLNYAPVLLFVVFLFFMFGRVSAAMFVTAVFFVVFALTNRMKVALRADPLVPSDIGLGQEAFYVVLRTEKSSIIKYLVVLGACVVLGVLAIIFIKNTAPRPVFRLAGLAAAIGLAAALNASVYADAGLYNSLPTIEHYNLVSNYNTKGLVYCFIYQINDTGALSVKKPPKYKKSDVEKSAASYTNLSDGAQKAAPHIFVIMSEAFSDLSNYPVFDFARYGDPLANFNAISREGRAGHIIVPHFGGGTADTEFEFLTGLSKREIPNTSYAFRLIGKSFDSVASFLRGRGYETVFIHPGSAWFYNRQNAYEFMGFNETYFDDAFYGVKLRGNYPNEYDTVTFFIDKFDEKLKNGNEKIFEFCVNIQNHGPFENKYLEYEKNFDINGDGDGAEAFSQTEMNALGNYFFGVKDADEGLRRVRDYLYALDEPALLLYFGDHLPSLSDSLLSKSGVPFNYSDFGAAEALYKTPFLFWLNPAACDAGLTLNEVALPPDGCFSALFLGLFTLKAAGQSPLPPLFAFLNELYKITPVLTKEAYKTSNGYIAQHNAPEGLDEMFYLYKQWQHYKLFDE